MTAGPGLDQEAVRRRLGPGPHCVLGVGNRRRGDDGVGSLIAARLAVRLGGAAVDAGVAPENHLERVARSKPATVVVVDAADFGGRPGAARLLAADEVATGGLSTHALSIAMAADYLKRRCGAATMLLGIQPADVGDSEGLSPAVARTARRVEELLARLIRAEEIATP